MIKRNFYVLLVALIFLLSLTTDWYYGLSELLLCATVVTVLDKLGKGIVLREIIVLHAVAVCLIAPIIGYEVYNRQNYLARIFLKDMRVAKAEYFGFVLPAVSAFAVAICWPITKNKEILDEGLFFQRLLNEIRKRVQLNKFAGIGLIVIGMGMFYVRVVLPVEFRFVATLFFSSCFAGVLYIYYSNSFRYKKYLLFLFAFFIVLTAVQSGVFTVIAYMGITLFSFFFVGKTVKLWKKILVCVACIFILFIIQTIKSNFRQITWNDTYSGNKVSLFTDIAADKLSRLDELIDVNALFPVYVRINQGFNISLVMRRIPAVKDFDNGSRLALIGASSLVPRLLWPDKPEAGGKESMLYFTGVTITGWSTNVGPIGEAYGSFGVAGGVLFMFLLGIFIRWAYKKVFTVADKTPLIVLWIPVLFFQVTYSMETDTLQILNSLFKSALFIYVFYKMFPTWFGHVKKSIGSIPIAHPSQNIPV